MKKVFFITAVFYVTFSSFGQKDMELFRINDAPIMVSEFRQMYEKNLMIAEDKEANDIESYLELFINYKLKVKEAYKLKLDTVKSYQKELESYKKELLAPYLYDAEVLNELVKEAYYRTKNEVKASHILVRYPSEGLAVDTLFLRNKIVGYRNRILQGEGFEKVAREVSEDPSAKINGGNLGYFKAFQMVYPFETAVYKTKVGEVSEPFKTKFGWHIVKVTDIRNSKGEFEAAHILVRHSSKGESKIHSLYKLLESGKLFEEVAKEHSEDTNTAKIGGKLPRFGTGKMVDEFENNVRNLKDSGDYSKPFKTKYGWHIAKLIKNYPVPSFSEMENELIRKVKQSKRIKVSDQALFRKLMDKYQVKEYPEALTVFQKNKKEELKIKELNSVLLSVNKKKFTQKDFLEFIKLKNKTITESFRDFKRRALLSSFKESLFQTNLEYRNTLLEYKEGLLLFDLMQKKIWNKASKDTLGLKSFYIANKVKYGKELDDIRGQVISDYQDELEKKWIKELRKNNMVRVRKGALRKLKNTYNQ
ncbi:peptidylprolyl isomerase [Tenacibaculum larymnensis]|uniref:Peptidylprolyl isomerase n=1 Tax=Tenacibaculum larymnensis TaxID=2878201 RepID=A0A9X4IRJ2_9FLAO|nr:peptidylprolyl isomerase [Tenacibaculum larymnensis]MDE1208286.1 peptidylprolyl isomerase [Tenacibaculum larymnensis]